MATRPWTPADMTSATPVLSLNPTNASTITNNAGAITLASEYGSITASAAAGNSPVVLAVNGYNFLDYTGGKYLALSTTTGLPLGSTARTILTIAMSKTSGGTQPGIWGYGNGNGGSFYLARAGSGDTYPNAPLFGTGGGGSNVQATTASTLVNTYRVMVGTITSAGAEMLRVDGAQFTATSATGLNTNTNPGYVGYEPAYGDKFSGVIGAIFIASGVASQDEIWRLESYYAFQCGMQSHIGSDNPYASAPPTVTISGGTLDASPGTLTISGQPATFANQSPGTLAANPGTFSVAGQPATFTGTLAASPGTYSVSGQPATFSASYTLPAAPGSYAVSGQSATFTQSSMLAASPGSFLIAGQSATFNTQAPGSLAASPGGFAVSGRQATFTGYLGAQPGAFSVSGKPATFTQATALVASPGSFVVTGKPATFSGTTTTILAAQPGSYSITGQPVVFVGSGHATLAAQAGAFAITGGATTFQSSALPSLAATFTAGIAQSFTSQIAGVFQ